MSATGTVTLDFGAAPGIDRALIAVTGQATIGAGSNVEAFMMYDTTADHTGNDHLYIASVLQLVCGTVIPGTGFTIYGVSTEKLQGTYQVRWVWV
jgi:hypothetical protein